MKIFLLNILFFFPVLLFTETIAFLMPSNQIEIPFIDLASNNVEISSNENIEQDSKIADKPTPIQELFVTVASNDIARLIQLLDQGVNVNSRDEQYRTPLMYVTDQSLQIVDVLLTNGAYINTKDRSGNTALMIASKNGHKKFVKFLLDNASIAVNSKNNEGYSALHFAVLNGDDEIVQMLIQKHADILEPLPNNVTSIVEASKQGFPQIVSLFLDKGISPNTTIKQTKTSILSVAVAFNNIATVKLLLERGADPNLANIFGVTPIFISVGKQNSEITKLLLAYGARTDLKTTDGTLLGQLIHPKDNATKKLLQKKK